MSITIDQLVITPLARMEIARTIADSAAALDYFSNFIDIDHCSQDSERNEAKALVEKLHDIAERMAGDRMNEIYAPEEKIEPLQLIEEGRI